MRPLNSVSTSEWPDWTSLKKLTARSNEEPAGEYWTLHQPNLLASDAVISVYIEAYLHGIANAISVHSLLVDYDSLSDSRLRTAHVPSLGAPTQTIHLSFPWRRYPPDATPSGSSFEIELHRSRVKKFIMCVSNIAETVSIRNRKLGIESRTEVLMQATTLGKTTSLAEEFFSTTRAVLTFYGLVPQTSLGTDIWHSNAAGLSKLRSFAPSIEDAASDMLSELAMRGITSSLLRPGAPSRVWFISNEGIRSSRRNAQSDIMVPGVILDDIGEAEILRSKRTFIYGGSVEHYAIAAELAERIGLKAPTIQICQKISPHFVFELTDIQDRYHGWIRLLDEGRYSHILRFLLWGDRIKDRISFSIHSGALDQ